MSPILGLFSTPRPHAAATARSPFSIPQEKVMLVREPFVAPNFLYDPVRLYAEWALCIVIPQASLVEAVMAHWTLGRSRGPPHCEHWVALKRRG